MMMRGDMWLANIGAEADVAVVDERRKEERFQVGWMMLSTLMLNHSVTRLRGFTARGKRVVVRVVLNFYLLLLSSYVEFLVLKKISQYSLRVRVHEFLYTLMYCTVACKKWYRRI